jgi:iron complex transport system permease protein
VDKLQLGIYALSALLTAVSVSSIGSVGFVGLIVPHGVRAWVGADHRRLIPCAALAGGSLLTLADTFSRTLASPLQLPVGVLMSMIGVPAFLLLLAKKAARG